MNAEALFSELEAHPNCVEASTYNEGQFMEFVFAKHYEGRLTQVAKMFGKAQDPDFYRAALWVAESLRHSHLPT